jgi:hypothetical protein
MGDFYKQDYQPNRQRTLSRNRGLERTSPKIRSNPRFREKSAVLSQGVDKQLLPLHLRLHADCSGLLKFQQ